MEGVDKCKLCESPALTKAMSNLWVSRITKIKNTNHESEIKVWICLECVRKIKQVFKDF